MNNYTYKSDWQDIRDGVQKICKEFPEKYWRDLDKDRIYPSKFVDKLSQSGYLAVLIPKKYGGAELPLRAASTILEEIHRSGGNAAACHAQMYIMGSLLRHGSESMKEKYLHKIANGELRLQAFGVTEPTSGSNTLAIKTKAEKKGKAKAKAWSYLLFR